MLTAHVDLKSEIWPNYWLYIYKIALCENVLYSYLCCNFLLIYLFCSSKKKFLLNIFVHITCIIHLVKLKIAYMKSNLLQAFPHKSFKSKGFLDIANKPSPNIWLIVFLRDKKVNSPWMTSIVCISVTKTIDSTSKRLTFSSTMMHISFRTCNHSHCLTCWGRYTSKSLSLTEVRSLTNALFSWDFVSFPQFH